MSGWNHGGKDIPGREQRFVRESPVVRERLSGERRQRVNGSFYPSSNSGARLTTGNSTAQRLFEQLQVKLQDA